MALTSNYNTIKIFNDLYEELDYFTHKKYTQNISKILNASFDADIKVLVRIILTLRKIRELNLLELHDPFALHFYKQIIKLLNSQHPLDNGDIYPMGMILSLVSCADKAQDILNVKRLKKVAVSTIENVDSELYKYIKKNLGMENRKLKPSIKDTSLHGCTPLNDDTYKRLQVFWFRITLDPKALVENLKTLLLDSNINTYLIDIGTISENNGILELYYNKKANLFKLLTLLNDADEVKEIIFCSDLIRMSKIKQLTNADIFSNMIKFYYIYKTYNLTFMMRNQHDSVMFYFVYSLCVLFMQSPNLTSANSKLAPNPISALSCSNPMFAIKEKTKTLEPITEFEKMVLSENPQKLNNTAASPESIQFQARHRVFVINQDRDSRVITGFPQVGGISTGEIVVTPEEDYERFTVEVLKAMSK